MTEQTQVGSRPAILVSDTVLEQLQRVADTRGIAANELAEQAIRHFLREERRRLLQRESEAFRALHEKLCLLYTSPSPRDRTRSRMPSSA